MKIKPSTLSDLCGFVDGILHCFVLCLIVLLFWYNVFRRWNSFNHIYGQYLDLPDTKEILFAIQPLSDEAMGLDFCVSYAKFFIYKQRLFHDNNYPMKDVLACLWYTLAIDICENKTHFFQQLQYLLDVLQKLYCMILSIVKAKMSQHNSSQAKTQKLSHNVRNLMAISPMLFRWHNTSIESNRRWVHRFR